MPLPASTSFRAATFFSCANNCDEFPVMSARATFRPTPWTLIAELRSGEAPRVRVALETLCGAYWYPLYAYARRCGQSHEDAADLTQAFFAQVVEKEILARAAPERGRLRTFLLTSMQRFLRDDWRKQQRLKRGGGHGPLAIVEPAAESLYAREAADPSAPEALYHRRWALALLERTLTGVQDDYAVRGKAELFDALKPTLTDDPDATSTAQLALQLAMQPGAVRVAISRLRRRYREKLLTEVAASLDEPTEADVNEEIAALFRALS